MKVFFKILAFAFGGYFVWAASVNANDQDATLWYFIYGAAVVASLLFIVNALPKMVYMILAVLFVIGGILFWPETYEGLSIGGGDIKNIEEGREALGLGINALVMLLYWWRTEK
jgi:hypothetical protein